ncbi:hypothetical protein ACLK19_06875 [Escherichia coli]
MTGQYLVQSAHGKPLNVLLMPDPITPGAVGDGRGFSRSHCRKPGAYWDIALGDNDIEIQRNLLQEMLERHPEIDSSPERPLRQRRQWVKGVT